MTSVSHHPVGMRIHRTTSSSRDGSRNQASFSTTLWTVVLTAGNEANPAASKALEQLCRRYWYPIYAHVRRRGHGPEDAEDLTQGFFLRVLRKRHFLSRLVRDKGRFRSLLLVWLKNFLANEHQRATRAKRGGRVRIVSFDAAQAEGWYVEGSGEEMRSLVEALS